MGRYGIITPDKRRTGSHAMNRKERRAQDKQNRTEKKSPAAALVTPEAIETTRVLLERNLYPEAKELFSILMELDPDNIRLLLYYATATYLNEDIDLAETAFQKVLALQPESTQGLAGMASVRAYQDRLEEAAAYIEKVNLEDIPANILTQMGRVYSSIGRIDAAKACFTRCIETSPEYPGAYYEMQNMKKYAADDPQLLQLNKLHAKIDELPATEQMMLEFTLGKACLDINETDKAFQHYAQGNAIKRKSVGPSQIEKFEAYADSLIGLFNEDFVEKIKGSGSIASDRPIFIVGMPRSGSTLVDQILSSHPKVGSFGEKGFLAQCIPALHNEEVSGYALNQATQKPKNPTITRRLLEAITPEALDIMGNNYLSKTDAYVEGAERLVDKMLFNYLWVGLIRLILPNARIIQCVRDPVDIGLSIWKLWFSSNLPWTYDLQEIGRYYNAYNKIMAHWHRLFPGEIYQVRYEEMVADQETQTRKLLEYCRLPWDDKVLHFYDNKRSVQTASVLQVRQPIYTDSVKKWKKFEKYLQPLIQEVEKSGAYPPPPG
jgi:tetratricopeptide (TPR) repeat protein